MATCPVCDGFGGVPDEDDTLDCVNCDGTGVVDPGESDVDAWESEVDRGIQAHRERNLDR